MQFFEML